jgi:hypothetical protein
MSEVVGFENVICEYSIVAFKWGRDFSWGENWMIVARCTLKAVVACNYLASSSSDTQIWGGMKKLDNIFGLVGVDSSASSLLFSVTCGFSYSSEMAECARRMCILNGMGWACAGSVEVGYVWKVFDTNKNNAVAFC